MSGWNERYAAEDYVYGTSPNEFVAAVAPGIQQGPVLCLAEGECRNAVYLAQQGHRVTAVDSSLVGLDKGVRLARERGVAIETVCCDLSEFVIEPES